MRCKNCGIQLSANNIDNCPNCGTAEDQGKKEELPKGLVGVFFNLTGLFWYGVGFAALMGFLIYMATKSMAIAATAFLVLLGFVAAGFLGLLSFDG